MTWSDFSRHDWRGLLGATVLTGLGAIVAGLKIRPASEEDKEEIERRREVKKKLEEKRRQERKRLGIEPGLAPRKRFYPGEKVTKPESIVTRRLQKIGGEYRMPVPGVEARNLDLVVGDRVDFGQYLGIHQVWRTGKGAWYALLSEEFMEDRGLVEGMDVKTDYKDVVRYKPSTREAVVEPRVLGELEKKRTRLRAGGPGQLLATIPAAVVRRKAFRAGDLVWVPGWGPFKLQASGAGGRSLVIAIRKEMVDARDLEAGDELFINWEEAVRDDSFWKDYKGQQPFLN